MTKKWTLTTVFVIAALLMGTGCGDSQEDPEPPGEGPKQENPGGDDPDTPDNEPFRLTLSEAGPMSFKIVVEPDDPQGNYYVGITTRADFDRLQTAQAVAEAFVQIEKGHGEIDWTTSSSSKATKPSMQGRRGN